jgi:hypothetical protein
MVAVDPVAPATKNHRRQIPMLLNHRLKKAAALALSLGAILPATATAKPVGPDPSGASFAIPQTPVVRITAPASGFDWGDAGIGAAGGLALALLGVGGGLVISHQRPRRARRTTGLPS